MSFYILENPEPFWGDYGNILIHGMSEYAERVDGKIQLYRTGPFVPPITFPGIWDVVVTNELKNFLQRNWDALTFLPVDKVHISTVQWEGWNTAADDPLFYPETGEPEDYILDKPHDPVSTDLIGNLWELIVPEVQAVSDILDWARLSSNHQLIVSDKAKNWLEEHVAQWVHFKLMPSDWLT